MSIFTGVLSDILAVPGGLVLGFGGESLQWQPLNLFLKAQDIPVSTLPLPLSIIGVSSGVGKGLPLSTYGKSYGKSLNLFVPCDMSSSQRNMNMYVSGATDSTSGTLSLHTVSLLSDAMSSSLPLFVDAPIFASSLNLILWRTATERGVLPLTITGYASEATANCVLYLMGPVGIDGSVSLVTSGIGAATNSLPMISEGY
jgi:hypothetical protein